MANHEQVRTDITEHRDLPSGLASMVEDYVTLKLGEISNVPPYKVQHYAGEFLAEDNLDRLKADVSQFMHVMYDLEVIDTIETDASQTMPDELFTFIFFCCVSNRFDESIQWKSSYGLAWDVKRMFMGLELESEAVIHSNAYFTPLAIDRELHVPGMSVHTLRVELSLAHDVEGFVDEDTGAGYLFNLGANSHFIPLIGR